MTQSIDTAPKDGTKILCICSDGKTRYCWWFGCSDVDGCWMTEETVEPVAWYAIKRLSPSLKAQALEALNEAVYMAEDIPPEGITTDQSDIIRRALESLPDV